MNAFDFHARNAPKEPENDPLTEAVIGACIEVHRELGPGLLESMYENAVCRELELRGIRFARQVPVNVEYKGVAIGETRIDLVVKERLIIELKAVEALTAVHRSQVICYLRATRLQLALLVNFNVPVLKDGIKRIILSS